MTKFEYTIKDPMGFHARPVGALAKLASKAPSTITVVFNDTRADARRMYQVLNLNIKTNDTMIIEIDGIDEASVKQDVLTLFDTSNL